MSKLTKSAHDKSCIRCGKEGETRAAHYNGGRQHFYGKGRGIKASDIATAELCHGCDQMFTEGSTSTDWATRWERSEEFLHLIMLTKIRRVENGAIKI